MSDILAQYGRVTIYNEPNHPSPIYHVEGPSRRIPTATLPPCLRTTRLKK